MRPGDNQLMRLFITTLMFVLAVFCGCNASAVTVRDQEIAECRRGEIATWNDGIDKPSFHRSLQIYYRHENAPSWFGQSEVESLIARSAKGWEGCGIPIRFYAPQQIDQQHPDTVLIQWNEAGSQGNFGLANLSSRKLSLGPKAFSLLHARNPKYDAMQTLQMTLSHELGHFLGLMAHSRRCVDVLSYYHDGSGDKCFTRDQAGIGSVPEYRNSLPTACDIERCRAVNNMSPLRK